MQIFNILSLFPELGLSQEGGGAPAKGGAGEAAAPRDAVPSGPAPGAGMALKVGSRFQATVLGREHGRVFLEAAGRRLVARGGEEGLEPGARVVIEVVKEGHPVEARLVSSDALSEDAATAKAAKELIMMRANAAWLLPRIKGSGEPLERMLSGLAKTMPEKGPVLELAASISLQPRPDPKAVESLFNLFSPFLLPSVKDELPQAIRQAVFLFQQQEEGAQGGTAASGGGATGGPAPGAALSQALESAPTRLSSTPADGAGPLLQSAAADGKAASVPPPPPSQEAAARSRPPAATQVQIPSSQEGHAPSPAAASKNAPAEIAAPSGPLGASQVFDDDYGLPLRVAGGGRGPSPQKGGVRTVSTPVEPGAKVSEGAVVRGGKSAPGADVAKVVEVSRSGTGAATGPEAPRVQEPAAHPPAGRSVPLLHGRGNAGPRGQPVQQAEGWRPDAAEPKTASAQSPHLQVLDGLARHIASPSFIHQALGMLGDLPLLIIPFWFGDGSILGHMATWKEEGEEEKGRVCDRHIFFDLEMDRLGHVSIDVLQRDRSIGVTVYAAESALPSVEAALPALGAEIEDAGYGLLWLRALPTRHEGRGSDLHAAILGGEDSHLIDIET